MFAAVFNVDALLGGSFSAKRLDVHIYIYYYYYYYISDTCTFSHADNSAVSYYSDGP